MPGRPSDRSCYSGFYARLGRNPGKPPERRLCTAQGGLRQRSQPRAAAGAGTLARVDEAAQEHREIVCPHCKKLFTAELIAGEAERYRGFKCPHCKLFVPADRARSG
jgi:DNA-directed RNA polymerase subunit RPC12/RpoP